MGYPQDTRVFPKSYPMDIPGIIYRDRNIPKLQKLSRGSGLQIMGSHWQAGYNLMILSPITVTRRGPAGAAAVTEYRRPCRSVSDGMVPRFSDSVSDSEPPASRNPAAPGRRVTPQPHDATVTVTRSGAAGRGPRLRLLAPRPGPAAGGIRL